MAFKSGMGLQDRVQASLSKLGYDFEQSETLDHDYKIDFAIRRYPQNPKHYSLGLQVTQRCDDLDKLREFNAVHSTGFQVVDRVLYVEVESSDFEKGVGHLLSTAISSFQFDSTFKEKQRSGVRLRSNMTYEFFDIETRLKAGGKASVLVGTPTESVSVEATPMPTQKVAVAPPTPKIDVVAAGASLSKHMRGLQTHEPQSLYTQGFINGYYKTKGNGFITAQDGASYFFRLQSVSDGQLRDRLLALPDIDWAVAVEGTIEFMNAGKTLPNAKYEEAKNVRFAPK